MLDNMINFPYLQLKTYYLSVSLDVLSGTLVFDSLMFVTYIIRGSRGKGRNEIFG